MLPLNLATARPVKRSEFVGDPIAMEAYWKEWSNLEVKGVWNWDTLAEWDHVSEAARVKGEEINFGYLFGFIVIKGDEFPEGDPRSQGNTALYSREMRCVTKIGRSHCFKP